MKMSRQQQAVYDAIMAAGEGGITSRDLVRVTDVCKYTNRLSELRDMGWDYRCDREGESANGASVFRYRPPYIKPGQQQLFPKEERHGKVLPHEG